MTAGMAEVIAAHDGYTVKMPNNVNAPFTITCNGCSDERPIINELGNVRTSPQRHAAHVAEELAKAGYGDVRKAFGVAADELARLPYVKPGDGGRDEYERMLAIRRGDTDKWLREKAESHGVD